MRANEEMLERNKKLLDEWEVEKLKLDIRACQKSNFLSNQFSQVSNGCEYITGCTKKIFRIYEQKPSLRQSFKFRTKIERKSAIFDRFFTKYFVLAITF